MFGYNAVGSAPITVDLPDDSGSILTLKNTLLGYTYLVIDNTAPGYFRFGDWIDGDVPLLEGSGNQVIVNNAGSPGNWPFAVWDPYTNTFSLAVSARGAAIFNGGTGEYGITPPPTQPTYALATSAITDANAKAAINALIAIINGSGKAAITTT